MSLISIIVPIYKVEAYLERCIQSIINQTYGNLEIILVDDGSPDKCPEICDNWAKTDSRIKVIHKRNGGLSEARNFGLDIATGDLIGFVDSDDWIAPEMYEKLLEAVERDNSDIAVCTVEKVWDGNEKAKQLLTVQENSILLKTDAQKNLLTEKKLKHPVWYKLYKKSVIQNIRFDVGKTHEDVYWSYKVFGNAEVVSIIDYIGYYYFQRDDSIMGEKYSIKWLDYIEAISLRHEYFLNNFPELISLSKQIIAESCIYHAQMALLHLSDDKKNRMISTLQKVRRQHRFSLKEYSRISVSSSVWIVLSRISLKFTAFIRNMLKIGT